MKAALDMLNFEMKKTQEAANDASHRATLQITELQGQLNVQSKNVSN